MPDLQKDILLKFRHALHRLQHRRVTFDEVAALSVEGLNKSAIARVKRMAWNTIDRRLQKAAYSCRRFNDQKIDGLSISELQADEVHTIIHDKGQPIWIFAAIEVWSHLWPSTVIGICRLLDKINSRIIYVARFITSLKAVSGSLLQKAGFGIVSRKYDGTHFLISLRPPALARICSNALEAAPASLCAQNG